MDSVSVDYSPKNLRLGIITLLFGVPLAAVISLPVYLYYFDLTWPIVLLSIFYYFATTISITAGYHRLFAHRTYKAKTWWQVAMLFFGAGALQNSAAKWCTDHRRHHKDVDTNDDPYSIKKGAFFAHLGWMIIKEEDQYVDFYEQDLLNNPLVYWQHKYHLPLCIFSGFFFPTFIGFLMGDAIGAFVFAVLIRMTLAHHVTFFVNSLCHMYGRQPYTTKNSAKDNFLVALLTSGEGYHNYHHCFEGDYRNGVLWYQWDPTKWLINLGSKIGATYNLRRVPMKVVLKSRLETETNKLVGLDIDMQKIHQLKEKIETLVHKVDELKAEYKLMKKNLQDHHETCVLQVKADLELARIELQKTMDQWRKYIRIMSAAPAYS